MSSFILALDQGTTSSRALIVDHSGGIVAVAQKEFTQFFPQTGWVEHDPAEIWASQLSVAKAAMRKAKVDATQIAAIGITNQRETTMIWNRRTGQPLHRAIVWQDRRTADICERLKKSKWSAEITNKTGLVIDAYFSGTKLQWLLEHVAGARELAAAGELAFGTIDSWLIWNLTGGTAQHGAVHKTDLTNAGRTLLCDIHSGQWDMQLLKALKIPANVLPEICASSEVVCHTDKKIFGQALPIAGIAGDQHAALFGQQCTQPGMVKTHTERAALC